MTEKKMMNRLENKCNNANKRLRDYRVSLIKKYGSLPIVDESYIPFEDEDGEHPCACLSLGDGNGNFIDYLVNEVRWNGTELEYHLIGEDGETRDEWWSEDSFIYQRPDEFLDFIVLPDEREMKIRSIYTLSEEQRKAIDSFEEARKNLDDLDVDIVLNIEDKKFYFANRKNVDYWHDAGTEVDKDCADVVLGNLPSISGTDYEFSNEQTLQVKVK